MTTLQAITQGVTVIDENNGIRRGRAILRSTDKGSTFPLFNLGTGTVSFNFPNNRGIGYSSNYYSPGIAFPVATQGGVEGASAYQGVNALDQIKDASSFTFSSERIVFAPENALPSASLPAHLQKPTGLLVFKQDEYFGVIQFVCVRTCDDELEMHLNFWVAEKGFVDFSQAEPLPSKYLTIIQVRSDDSGSNDNPYGDGWWLAPATKETDAYQLVSLANIRNLNKIVVCKFPNTLPSDINTYISTHGFEISYGPGSSNTIVDAFKTALSKAIELSPSSYLGIRYSGHGWYSGLFSGDIANGTDAAEVLQGVNDTLGHKVDFLDWSHCCNVATLMILEEEYAYTDYVIASDLYRFGAGFMSTFMQGAGPDDHFYSYFSPNKSIRDSIVDMLDGFEHFWMASNGDKAFWADNHVWQSVGAFDTAEYASFRTQAKLGELKDHPRDFGNANECYDNNLDINTPYPGREPERYVFKLNERYWDIYNMYIKKHYPQLTSDFTGTVRFRYATNRAAFNTPWTEANGLQLPESVFQK